MKERCPICKSELIKHKKIEYESIDVKRCFVTGIKKVLICPIHWEYVIEIQPYKIQEILQNVWNRLKQTSNLYQR